jgi:uncharacterized protein (TIGR03663 family)
MHADESVHADKLGNLLERGRYEYSTADYHGPTLYYVALLAARARGIRRYADLDEVDLRAIPAVLGVLLVAAHYWLVPYIGLAAAAAAALFTAVSPAMVYYSRYFIHETLLVFLIFVAMLAVFAYFRRPGAGLAVAIGAIFGLMYATKETWILAAACMAVAGVFIRHRGTEAQRNGKNADSVADGPSSSPGAGLPSGSRKASRLPAAEETEATEWAARGRPFGAGFKGHVLFAAGSFLLVAAVFMSSFFTHPRGVVDSVLAYSTYFARGAGVNTFHVHPWYFYFHLLFWFHGSGAPVFSEAFLGVLALVGICVARGIGRFLAIYTVLMIIVSCAIPYKAPWNLLEFWQGTILLAGIGTAWLAARAPKMLVLPLLALGVAHLGWQAYAASFPYSSDPRNPWVYAHTGADVFVITQKLSALAAVHPDKMAMPVQVVTRQNLWPLPWYLRRYSGIRWWNGVSMQAPLAPVILATPDMEPALLHRIYEVPPPGQREMYVNLFDRYVELRPRVEVRGYVAKSLWDSLREMP